MMRIYLFVVISTFLIQEVINADEPSRTVKPVLFWTGSDSKQHKVSFSRCGTQKDWQVVWGKHCGPHDGQTFPPPCPEIDFSAYMVVAIFAGEGSSDVGLLIDSVTEEKDCLRLRYRPFTYQTFSASFGLDLKPIVPKAEVPVKKRETCSYGFIVLPKSPKTLVIEEGIFPRGLLSEPLVWKMRVKLPDVAKESKLTELEARTIAEKYIRDQKGGVKYETPSLRYSKDEKTWHVTFHYIPARPGGFATVIVDDLTANVLRVEGGE